MNRWREPGAPRGSYHHAKWHDWWVCRACGAVVEDWPVHDDWHAGQESPAPADAYALEVAARDMTEEMAARARAEGNAVVEAGAWRQVRDIFRLRPPREA